MSASAHDIARDALFGALAPILDERIEGREAMDLHPLEGGASNRTYALDWGTKRYVLRAPPRGSTVLTHDARREFRALKAASAVFARAPRPIHLVKDLAALGTPFFIMEWRPGRPLFAAGSPLDGPRLGAAVSAFARCLADLHRLDATAPGLCELGAPRGFVERLVRGLHHRWTSAAEDNDDARALAAWLSARVPAAQRVAVLHNDFKPDNLLWSDSLEDITAVLDWELCSLGDPLVDLGLVLAYWPDEHDSEDRQTIDLVTRHPRLPARQGVLDAYASGSDLDLGSIRFYEVLGLFKIAVLMQQIVARGERAASRFVGAPTRVLREARRTAELR